MIDNMGCFNFIISYVAKLCKKNFYFQTVNTKYEPESANISNEKATDHLTSSTLAVSDFIEVSASKQMSIGKKKFNIDPKKGIEYLIENGLITYDATDIANFLLTGEGLNKSMIGQYLCTSTDFHKEVLNEFIHQQNFKDLLILQALREYLWTFHPAGDSQKIERCLKGFAEKYYDQNPSVLEDAEQCFSLSYTIILLNTLLHNPCVKDKPSKEMFKLMLQEDGTFPQDLIEQIYESVKAEPFKKSDGDELMHTFFNPEREGWLWKQGGRYKSWKRRWFILTDKCLYYFEYTTDSVPRGIIPLENVKLREVTDRKMGNCFEIYNESTEIVKACKSVSNGKMVEGHHTKYRISAISPKEKQDWMKAIRKNTLISPFYEMICRKV